MNISIDKLKYFVEAAQTEHIGKAARQLHISPSVVSASIKHIEQELGKELFHRSKKSISLTHDGEKLYQKAKGIILSLEDLYNDNSHSIRGEFKLGISLSLYRNSPFKVADCIRVIKENPHSQFSINTSDTGRLIDLVIHGLLDAAIVYSPIKHEKLREEILEETEFFIALKKSHPIFKLQKSKQIQMLNELPAIGFNASVGNNMCQRHPIFDTFGIQPNYRYFYDIDEVALSLVQKTGGWIFTSQNIIESNKSIQKLKLGKEWKVPMTISLIYNRDKASPPFLNALGLS